jgi:hypothetical protein
MDNKPEIFIKSFNYYNPTHQFKGFSYNSDGSMNAVYECKNGMLDYIPIIGDPMFDNDITPRIKKIAGNNSYYIDSTGVVWRMKNGELNPVRYNIRGGSYDNNMHYYFKTEIYNDIYGGVSNEETW